MDTAPGIGLSVARVRFAQGFFIGCLAFIFSIAGLCAGAAEKPPLEHERLGVANGCFVESVAFLDRWHERFGAEAWARLLQWGAKEEDEVAAGHAVAVVEARGQLWCWDINFGWKLVPVETGQRENVAPVAASILTRYPKIAARFPLYRSDFPQSPSATPPIAQPAHANPSVRDASMVGERLARRRPVNVVRFTHGGAGAERESAAVIFVFHGRYCVYVPEIGTIPFRARGSVENLALIQQALRRMMPGATQVRKL